jgi:membrane-associated phospholipid phosphatase
MTLAFCMSSPMAQAQARAASTPQAEHAAPANPVRQLQWDPAWKRFDGVDIALTGALGAVAFGALLVPIRGREATPPAVDASVRDSLRASTHAGRSLAANLSDVSATFVVAYPVLGDALVNAAGLRDSPDVAVQLSAVYLQAAAIAGALNSVTKVAVGRERPYGRECGAERDLQSDECEPRHRYVSFYSSHASTTFTAASVSCAFGHYLPLWTKTGAAGDGALWPCIVGYSLAAGTGVLRVVADQHYASDVLVGAVSGTLVGWIVPWLRFGERGPEPSGGSRHDLHVAPLIGSRSGAGVTVSGVF